MSTPLETIQAIYAAFGQGDIDGIVSHMADDVKWEHWQDNYAQKANVDWLRKRQGKQGVRDFFASISAFQFPRFEIESMLDNGNKVAVEVELTIFLPALNIKITEQEMHLWTLDTQAKVTFFRHYLDTAKHIELYRAVNH